MMKFLPRNFFSRRKLYVISWTIIVILLITSLLEHRPNNYVFIPNKSIAHSQHEEKSQVVEGSSQYINITNVKNDKKDYELLKDSKHLIDFVREGEDLKIPPPNTEKKIILYWTNWYNPKTSWEWRMSADDLPTRLPDQRWVWVDVESPVSARGVNGSRNTEAIGSHQFNWTMSYHISSDIMAMHGYFLPKNIRFMPMRANLLVYHNETLQRYLQAANKTSSPEETTGKDWNEIVRHRRPIVWMSSNCDTFSRREEYVFELHKYIRVDKYGECGKYRCGAKYQAFNEKCWVQRLRKKYLFSLAFENSLCNHYISEKPYNPLVHGLVPIVWGGEGYEHFLPPGSYINARLYHPRELAELVKHLMKNPAAYGRYHLWRQFWTAKLRGSICELCHRLHTDPVRGHHRNISAWRQAAEQCFNPKPNLFESHEWKRVIVR
ncbi:alpha-(1,3)-fucosyltransferase C-like isoform X2 [Palaemon carinicauda]|uniref:alpha-(1,3)-fucosyltransferase C-like isoform X2 n=1 Tax=Palaemon carinicauda TaxID=392227 RepID=UPI0035B63CFA